MADYKMLFLVGLPRSGTTMLEHMLSSHSMIQGGPEPHILTPLAYLGVWDKVDKAPYDHILSAEAQKLFVQQLPNKEKDYWEACRAYCDVLYSRYLQAKGNKKICLDKTPAYSLVLPFIAKVYPDAKYIILTRHPIATFSSFANSFFDGNYKIAQAHNPILNRYIPVIADFLRKKEVDLFHIKYEDLVKEPEMWFEKICEFIDVPYEPEAIEYGKMQDEEHKKGLGDPLGVKQHTRPTTSSLKKWVEELSSDPEKLKMMREIIERIADEDLEIFGYPKETIWKPLEDAKGIVVRQKKQKLNRYLLERKAIIYLREFARRNKFFRKVLDRIHLACEVLLRE
ncbi:MAG: sulfotransferase [Candidatus Hydrogenedentes bacterium]|nr:sulfotransferase [Candidatus Hydrogenedentota bacterium]